MNGLLSTLRQAQGELLSRELVRGVTIFAKNFSGRPARKISKNHATTKPSAAPIRPASLVSTQQGVET
jgi:hypothetical protein